MIAVEGPAPGAAEEGRHSRVVPDRMGGCEGRGDQRATTAWRGPTAGPGKKLTKQIAHIELVTCRTIAR